MLDSTSTPLQLDPSAEKNKWLWRVWIVYTDFSCTLLCDRLIPDICYCDSHRHISYLTLTCIHLLLVMFNTWYLISLFVMLITWYRTPVLAMLITWYRYQYLPCYTYYLISDTDTCHAILIACYLTLDIITFDTWHAITRYWYTWPNIVAPVLFYIFMTITFTGTWHDYYIVTRYLVLLNSCAPELLHSWTLEKG